VTSDYKRVVNLNQRLVPDYSKTPNTYRSVCSISNRFDTADLSPIRAVFSLNDRVDREYSFKSIAC
jgi:hypothetical protein